VNKIADVKDNYLILDMPGQIETYINSESFKGIIAALKKNKVFTSNLVAVELFDSYYCYDSANFLSICMTALNSLMNLELPHINVLSKIDMIKEYGKLPARLTTYTTELDLEQIFLDLQSKSTRFSEKYISLNKEIVDVVDAYNLVSFYPLDVSDKKIVSNLVVMIDKANGFFYFLMNTQNGEELLDIRNNMYEADTVFSSMFMLELEDRLGLNEEVIEKDEEEEV